MKNILMLLTIILSAQFVWSVDKKALEVNIRKSLNLTTKQKIVVGDAKPSNFADLEMVQISIDGGQYPVYLAPDGKQYFWGQIFNMAEDPDKIRASKINLKTVHSMGSAKAPVTVVEYTDMQCPYCKRSHLALKESLYKDFTKDQVRLVFKQFPLNMHKWAEEASIASECAADQKESFFWDVTGFFFQDQDNIKPENIKEKTAEIAARLKLDKTKLEQCVSSKSTLPRVIADRNEGSSIGVSGTPTFIVNGRMLRGTDYEDLKLLIKEKIEESNSK